MTIDPVDVDDLRRRVRAAQRDSMRYCWLLSQMSYQQCGPNVGWTLDRLMPGDDPEAAIDAAMTADLGG